MNERAGDKSPRLNAAEQARVAGGEWADYRLEQDDIRTTQDEMRGFLVGYEEAVRRAGTAPSATLPIEEKLAAVEREVGAKQAEIDRLMLEYCPEEMTGAQIAEWKKHQLAAGPEAEAAIERALNRTARCEVGTPSGKWRETTEEFDCPTLAACMTAGKCVRSEGCGESSARPSELPLSHLAPVMHRWAGPYHDRLEYLYANGKQITMKEIKGLLNAALSAQSSIRPSAAAVIQKLIDEHRGPILTDEEHDAGCGDNARGHLDGLRAALKAVVATDEGAKKS